MFWCPETGQVFSGKPQDIFLILLPCALFVNLLLGHGVNFCQIRLVHEMWCNYLVCLLFEHIEYFVTPLHIMLCHDVRTTCCCSLQMHNTAHKFRIWQCHKDKEKRKDNKGIEGLNLLREGGCDTPRPFLSMQCKL